MRRISSGETWLLSKPPRRIHLVRITEIHGFKNSLKQLLRLLDMDQKVKLRALLRLELKILQLPHMLLRIFMISRKTILHQSQCSQEAQKLQFRLRLATSGHSHNHQLLSTKIIWFKSTAIQMTTMASQKDSQDLPKHHRMPRLTTGHSQLQIHQANLYLKQDKKILF